MRRAAILGRFHRYCKITTVHDATALITLSACIVLPLAIIGFQLLLDLDSSWGVFGYSLYKVSFVIPPLIYCRVKRVSVRNDVLRLYKWRQHLGTSAGLGVLAVLIFWSAYAAWGDLLLDKPKIVGKMDDQFRVTSATVLIIAPITIFFNSFLEEFFYRAFGFGLLVQRSRWLGWTFPAAVFTTQHMLFIYHWVTPLPLAMAIAGLVVFALVAQKVYLLAGSIVAPWVVHILGDVAMMGIAVDLLN